jgi:hypothetical protein
MTKTANKAIAKKEAKTAPAQKKITKVVAKNAQKISVAKNYFTIHEDNIILESIKKGNEKTKTEISKELALRLNRPIEAIRDRIKRYISKLNATDQASIQREAKKNGNQYIFFKNNADGSKKIEKIATAQPSLQNREANRPLTGKAGTKKAAKGKAPENKLAWIAQKLQDKDHYFRLDFTVQLLTDILNVAVEEEGVSAAAVEKMLNTTFCNLTLEQILEHLNVKKDK